MLNDQALERDALEAALVEIERFVGHGGWDQPARLFALVETDALIAAEPALAQELKLRSSAESGVPGALTSIEQEEFRLDEDLGETLARIAWPETVHGCALAIERAFLPPEAEADLPADPDEAAVAAVKDPRHDELRLVCGAVRSAQDPVSAGVARVRSHGELMRGSDLVPGLEQALAATLLAPTDATR